MDFFLAILLALATAFLVGRIVGPLGWMDHPLGRRQHERPIPRTGGIALLTVAVIGFLANKLNLPFTPWQFSLLAGIGLMGALDDRFDLRARWKALVGLVIAVLLAWEGAALLAASPHHLQLFNLVPLPHHWISYFPLLVITYWSLPHAFNLIDGANGLSIGYALLVTLVLWGGGTPSPYLLGLLAGLLIMNWPRAYHFLGDCGALILGLGLAILSVHTFGTTNPDALLWIFAYPIADVSMVVAIRLMQKRSLGEGDRNHLHHQLQDRFPKLKFAVVPLLWLLSGGTAFGAIAQGRMLILPLLTLSALLMLVGLFATLSYREHRGMQEREDDNDADLTPLPGQPPVVE